MKILLYVSGILLLLACRTPVNMTERADGTVWRQGTERADYGKDFQENVDRVVRERVNELRKNLSELDVEYNRTSYSMPDSMGKQYPTQVETGKLSRKTEEDSQRLRQKDELYEALTSEVEQFSLLVDSIEDRVTKVVTQHKEKPTWYQSALIFLGGLFLVYIIVTLYIKMKRP